MLTNVSIAFLESRGSDETFVTIYISNVTNTNVVDIHTIASFFQIVQDGLAGFMSKSSFEWREKDVYQGFIVRNQGVEKFYDNCVKATNRFTDKTAVRRITF